MMVFKRKEILVGALIVLIGVAAVVNYNYNKKDISRTAENEVNEQITAQAESYSVSAVEEDGGDVKMMGEAQQVAASAQEKADYFSQAKLNRESARSKKLEILNEVVQNENSDEDSKSQAQADIIKMADCTDKEAVCENLIIAKGFENAVVFIDGENVSVTVKKENFSDADAAKVQEIVASNTGIDTKYIKIVAV